MLSKRKAKSCSDDRKAALDTALGLLARREHSALELRHKLARRGFEQGVIDQVLAECVAESWLSDVRFAEVYAHARADKGYGPLRIRHELRERDVDDDTVAEILRGLADFWPQKLIQVQRKRFASLPQDNHERARQLRFLRHRGYTVDDINELFRS